MAGILIVVVGLVALAIVGFRSTIKTDEEHWLEVKNYVDNFVNITNCKLELLKDGNLSLQFKYNTDVFSNKESSSKISELVLMQKKLKLLKREIKSDSQARTSKFYSSVILNIDKVITFIDELKLDVRNNKAKLNK